MESKIIWTLLYYIFIFKVRKISGFNLDSSSPIIYEGPLQSKMFGYSLATHSYSGKQWLLVGAPSSNVTSLSSSETFVNYGAIFKCEYKPGSKECTEILLDNQPLKTEELTLSNRTIAVETEVKTNQWLGATLYSTGENGRVVTCAPRYKIARPTDDESVKNNRYLGLNGRCFQLRQDLEGVQGPEVTPCGERVSRDFGNCLSGISAEYSADGYDLLLGTVGIRHRQGGVAAYSLDRKKTVFTPKISWRVESYMGYAVTSGHFLSPRTTEYVGGAPRDNSLYGKVLLYSRQNESIKVTTEIVRPQGITIGSYFGSVLCSVDTNNDMYSDLLVGAPRAQYRDEGRVFVYVNNRKGALNLQDSQGLKGDNIPNAQFGTTIARVGDLNKDGYQDIAVGAPFEGEDGSGAVYIYRGSYNGINPNYKQKIQGSSVEPGLRQFGSAITGTVDMDENDYPDVAVGAYRSNKAVLFRTRSIVNLEGRIHLSRKQIAIESNDGLCRLPDGNDHKCLNLSVCFTLKNKAIQYDRDLQLSYTVELDKKKACLETDAFRRMFFMDDLTKERIFVMSGVHNLTKKRDSYCSRPRTVYLKKKDNLADVASSLTFDLRFGLVKSCGNDLCPVLNDSVQAHHTEEVFFMKKCKNQHVCVPDLAVNGKVILVGYDGNHTFDQNLRIGLVRELILQVTVTNKANDHAYYSKLLVKYPRSLGYLRTGDCKDDLHSRNNTGSQSSITCDVGTRIALPGLSKHQFDLKFSAESVEKDLTIIVKTESQDFDANKRDNSKEFFVAVKYEADLEVRGYSKPDQVIYSGTVVGNKKVEELHEEEIGPEVIQTITVRNFGPSVVDESKVTITVPKLLRKSDPESYLIYLLQVEVIGPGSCDVPVNPRNIKSAKGNHSISIGNVNRDRRDVISLNCSQAVCQSFQCSLGRMRQGDTVEIKLTSRLWKNTFLKLDEPLVVELETLAQVHPPTKVMQRNEENDIATIVLTAKPERRGNRGKSIPWWVYLLSALGGILLLTGVIFLLYKLGFFKRRKDSLQITDDEIAPMNKA
ncbi:integrin alpha-4-like [Porites lutea]|uniref:integrin alpha-4-like n=1 Tax=Porites lutea TaxID=51062 RepID=UPI003CC5B35F